MFVSERQNEIRKALLKHKKISVSALAKRLHVTEVTIRKDLEQLEQEGFLIRQHGGAILKEDFEQPTVSDVVPFSFSPPKSKTKRDIALLCVQYIQNDDIVFLGGDDIGCLIAEELQKAKHLSHLIVVTNCLYVLFCLASIPFVTLISLGGRMYSLNGIHANYGASSNAVLETLYISKSFIQADAFSYEQGFMNALLEINDLNRRLISRTDEVIITLEASKINRRSLYPLLDIEHVHTIVTSNEISNDFKKYCFDSGTRLFTTLGTVVENPLF